MNEDGFFVFQCCVNRPVLVCHGVAVYRYFLRQESCSRQRFSDKFLAILYFCERKKQILAEQFPQYQEQAYNMEARVQLEFLHVLCGATDKKYLLVQKQSVRTFQRLRAYHTPLNGHYKRIAWVVTHRLYPLYKWMIRMKYYR